MSPQQILTSVMMRIVVDKSMDHAKPHLIRFFHHNFTVNRNLLSEHKLKKAFRDTLPGEALSLLLSTTAT